MDPLEASYPVDWSGLYRPVLGCKLHAVVFEPITADTRTVVSKMDAPQLSYSGRVRLIFDNDHKVVLTWSRDSVMTLVPEVGEHAWGEDRLDRISASWCSLWKAVQLGTLALVELFSHPASRGRVVCARHSIDSNGSSAMLWTGTADAGHFAQTGAGTIEPMDDLWISVGPGPSNISDLTLTQTISR